MAKPEDRIPSHISFHYMDPKRMRPREESERDFFYLPEGSAVPPLSVGDMVTYFGGSTGEERCQRKVLAKHFFLSGDDFQLQVIVTDLTEDDKQFLTKS